MIPFLLENFSSADAFKSFGSFKLAGWICIWLNAKEEQMPNIEWPEQQFWYVIHNYKTLRWDFTCRALISKYLP